MYPLVSLGDVVTHYTTYIDAPEFRLYPKLSVKLYGKGVVLDEPADGANLRMKRHQLAKAGQVIVSEIWGKKGAIGIVPPQGDGALCTSHFFLFDIQADKVLPQYLQYIFSANYLEPQLNKVAKGTTGYAAVRPKNFLAAEIPLPPLDQQQRIVAHIDAIAAQLSAARDLRQQAVEDVDAFVNAARRHRFATIQNTTVVALEDICETIIDNLHSNPIYSEDGEYPCIRSSDVGWGELFLETARRTNEVEYRRRIVRGAPQTGDIVLVREGGGTGKAALVDPDQIFSLGQRVMMLRPNQNLVLPRFMLNQILSPQILEEQILPQTKGSASPHLNISSLRKFSFILPSLEEQQHIIDYLDEVVLQSKKLNDLQAQSAAEMDALLPSLLDRAFAGHL